MKRFISIVVIFIMCISMCSNVGFADSVVSYGVFGVITDANGNIVEVLQMPRTKYVDTIKTIPAGGSFISYQYEITNNYAFGVFYFKEDGTQLTELGYDFEAGVQMSDSVGGEGRFSTVKKYNTYEEMHTKLNAGMTFYTPKSRYGYKYYNAVLNNISSCDLTFRLTIEVDR